MFRRILLAASVLVLIVVGALAAVIAFDQPTAPPVLAAGEEIPGMAQWNFAEIPKAQSVTARDGAPLNYRLYPGRADRAVVLVHGFRPQVNEQLKAKGHVPKYSHGMRITDEVALDSAQEAAGQLRYEIEAAFSQGLPNTPMAGSTVRVISGNFITARPVGVLDGVDFQHSGLVRKVDAVEHPERHDA